MLKNKLSIRNVLAIGISLAMMTVFVSCEKGDAHSGTSIVGKWVTSDYNAGHNDTITFTSSMRVEDYFIFSHTTLYPASSYYYTYSLTDNKITITSHQPEIEAYSEIFEFILNGNSLKIKGFSNPFSLSNEARADVNFTKIK
ncbi:MAG: lipocalin family protein [Chitinophagales bacterium]|nr:lipocalin family protein [Chitinophagales bacterium]